MNKTKNYFVGIVALIAGIYFSYLSVKHVGRMGWDIFSPGAQVVTTRHGLGEDLSQLILSLVGAIACYGTAFGYIVLFKDEDFSGEGR